MRRAALYRHVLVGAGWLAGSTGLSPVGIVPTFEYYRYSSYGVVSDRAQNGSISCYPLSNGFDGKCQFVVTFTCAVASWIIRLMPSSNVGIPESGIRTGSFMCSISRIIPTRPSAWAKG